MLSLARMYMLHSPVPSWGAQYLAPSPEAMRAMQLGLALPAAVTLLWVPPMTDGWGVPPAALAAAAPVLLAVTAASQLLALRLLAQLHLNGGLLEWHQLAHDGTQVGRVGVACGIGGRGHMHAGGTGCAAPAGELGHGPRGPGWAASHRPAAQHRGFCRT